MSKTNAVSKPLNDPFPSKSLQIAQKGQNGQMTKWRKAHYIPTYDTAGRNSYFDWHVLRSAHAVGRLQITFIVQNTHEISKDIVLIPRSDFCSIQTRQEQETGAQHSERGAHLGMGPLTSIRKNFSEGAKNFDRKNYLPAPEILSVCALLTKSSYIYILSWWGLHVNIDSGANKEKAVSADLVCRKLDLFFRMFFLYPFWGMIILHPPFFW